VALDDDAFMNVNDIRKVPNYFYLYQNAGLLAFRVIHAKTGEKQNDHGDKAVAVANFHGAAHAIRKNLFNIVGYSDEDCKFGAEEFDFSVRCHAAGYQTIYLPDVQALHNSFPRSGRLGVFRREKWTYGYIRVIFKHFPTRMAYLYSFRYIILNFIWNRKFIDLQFVVSVLRSAFLGRRHGKMAREPLPTETVKFYSDPTLFPQFGNVPFNVMGRLKKKLLKW
jgi:GT2 family glycosyltransferase